MSTASSVSVKSAGAAASRGVLGRGSVYTLGAAAPILAYAAVVPIATRLLGKQAYGVVAISIVVITVAMMAGSLGMPSVIVRQGILADAGVGGARALLVRGSLMTAGLMGVIILTAPVWDQLVKDPNPLVQAQLRSAVPLALAASAFFVVVENSQALLRVLDRPGSFVVLSLTATLGGPYLGSPCWSRIARLSATSSGSPQATQPQRHWGLSCACGAVIAGASVAIPARLCVWDCRLFRIRLHCSWPTVRW